MAQAFDFFDGDRVRSDRPFPVAAVFALSPVFGLGVGLLMLDVKLGVAAGTLTAVVALLALASRLRSKTPLEPSTATEIAAQRRLQASSGSAATA